ncbi:MAG: dihydrofolate reductase [Bacteroidia bacterium]|nr:dihydrofolate reductase [Bacteroidia bacterium]
MIALIVAVGNHNEIGLNNQLLWHLPDDFKWFKKNTLGYPVVMGRKTFDSIGKALPGRLNVVISKTPQNYPNVEWADSIDNALSIASKENSKVFILGGESIFKALLPSADILYLTKVYHSFDADVFFPEINPQEWKLVYSQYHPKDEKHLYNFEFQILERIPHP